MHTCMQVQLQVQDIRVGDDDVDGDDVDILEKRNVLRQVLDL